MCPVICLISPAEKYEQFKATPYRTPTRPTWWFSAQASSHQSPVIPVDFQHRNTTADTEDVTFDMNLSSIVTLGKVLFKVDIFHQVWD